MAIQTRELVRMDEDQFVLSFDYDDVAMQITTIRAINTNPDRGYSVTATARAVNRSSTVTIPAATTIEQPVPQGVAGRLQVTVDAAGRLRGVSWSAS